MEPGVLRRAPAPERLHHRQGPAWLLATLWRAGIRNAGAVRGACRTSAGESTAHVSRPRTSAILAGSSALLGDLQQRVGAQLGIRSDESRRVPAHGEVAQATAHSAVR